MAKRTIADVEVHDRRILLRVDFNVPMEDGQILDDLNLRLALPTIRNIIDRGGMVILLTHLGVPDGKGFDPLLTLRPLARRLSELLRRPVPLAPDCVGPAARNLATLMHRGDVMMLENLRFHEEEILNSDEFAAQLAGLGDIYVNEAFAVSHRAHASMDALPRTMHGRPRVAGLQLWRELHAIKSICDHPQKPCVLILGGTRAQEKLASVLALRDKVDTILVGGALAHCFLAAERKGIGRTEVQPQEVRLAAHALEAAVSSRAKVMLPLDHVCATQASSFADTRVSNEIIPEGYYGLDIGPRTTVAYAEVIRHAHTVLWTGPMGAWETRPFDVGTKMIALACAHTALINHGEVVVAGGSLRLALERFGLDRSMTHLGAGGSATLAMLENQRFPGIALLDDRSETVADAVALL